MMEDDARSVPRYIVEKKKKKRTNVFFSLVILRFFNTVWCFDPHNTVILKEYFENIPLKSCNIAKIFIKLLERFLKYCRNLSMSVQNIINGILLQY